MFFKNKSIFLLFVFLVSFSQMNFICGSESDIEITEESFNKKKKVNEKQQKQQNNREKLEDINTSNGNNSVIPFNPSSKLGGSNIFVNLGSNSKQKTLAEQYEEEKKVRQLIINDETTPEDEEKLKKYKDKVDKKEFDNFNRELNKEEKKIKALLGNKKLLDLKKKLNEKSDVSFSIKLKTGIEKGITNAPMHFLLKGAESASIPIGTEVGNDFVYMWRQFKNYFSTTNSQYALEDAGKYSVSLIHTSTTDEYNSLRTRFIKVVNNIKYIENHSDIEKIFYIKKNIERFKNDEGKFLDPILIDWFREKFSKLVEVDVGSNFKDYETKFKLQKEFQNKK